jgi:hypothetical protein
MAPDCAAFPLLEDEAAVEDRDDLAKLLMADMPAAERDHFVDVIRQAGEEELAYARRHDPDPIDLRKSGDVTPQS